jgi:hypothetical protein
LPKNVKNLIFYDILIEKIIKEELILPEMDIDTLKYKIYDIIKQGLLAYDELLQMLSEKTHLVSFL